MACPEETVVQESKTATPGPEPEPKIPATRKGWRFALAFLALGAVAFASALDATILSIALPVIAADLKATSLESFWAGISFLLTTVLFQPISTICSDIFGRKLVLYVCIGIFGAGSIIVGCAQNMTVLIAGRTIQGVGGGGLEALSEIILTDMTTLQERALYLGIMGFIWAAGAVLGPIVGGAFAQYVSWRWIAWINLPLISIAIVLVPPFLTLNQKRQSWRSKFRRIDYVGIGLFVIGLTSFILPATWGGTLFAWSALETLVPLVFGIVVLVVFGWYESRPAEPMIPLRFFTNRTCALSLLSACMQGIVLWCALFYLPLYFQEVLLLAPLRAAVAGFPLDFTVMPLAIVAAFAIQWTRRYRWCIWSGWVFLAVGMGCMSLFGYRTSKSVLDGVQVVAGIGAGTLFPALAIPIQASVEPDDAGLAIGTFVFFRSLGAVLGVALGSSIFSNRFGAELRALVVPPDVHLDVESLAVNFVQTLRTLAVSEELKAAILTGYSAALRWVWIALAIVSVVGFVTSLFIKGLSLEKTEMGRQAFQEKRSKRERGAVAEPRV
ncbi:MAG: hypothetical protein M1832_004679 [Thelocarpon impressellum]|nr:MAG: hypothetical protein M1832_004679 [Thelocarpon impressellum]